MEDKKTKYKRNLEELNKRNQSFIVVLERLTLQHGKLVDISANSIYKLLQQNVKMEAMHYESLNMLTPEKAKVIKNF